MNLIDALNIVLEEIDKLEKMGISVTMKPSNGRNNPALHTKFAHRLPPEKWNHVTFHVKNNEHRNAVSASRIQLGNQGIVFDTGHTCCGNEMDWEIDWSLHLVDANGEKCNV